MGDGNGSVLLGKIAGTHGIRGELRVVSYSGEYDTLATLGTFLLKGATGELKAYPLDSVRIHGNKAIVRLKGFSDINQVAHLVGQEILVRRDQLPELEEGEYYWHDLIGLSVATLDGDRLGTLTDIISTGSNDVYVVTDEEREYLIPATEEVVRNIDLGSRTMTVSLLEGLLDL
jgi:16S rRNA processing protein RimM